MKGKIRKDFPCKWLLILLVQLISMLILGILVALSYYLGSWVHGALFWGGLSIAGFVSALMATRRGLLNYAAWIAPPLMGLLGHIIIWSYAPGAGAIFLCAFVSLVGAATGEVLKNQDRQQQRRK